MRESVSIGVDIGGTKTLAVIFARGRGILAREQMPTDRYSTPEALLPRVAQLATQLAQKAEIPMSNLSGIGIGVPGLVSVQRRFIDSIILPNWHSVDVEAWIAQELGLRTAVDNDATMAAIGHWQTSRNAAAETLLCLTLGTGVGASVLLGGKPFRGPDGTAGQLGHLSIAHDGRTCACGSRGCLNAYVSGSAIATRYSEALSGANSSPEPVVTNVTGETVAVVAERGDRLACDVIQATGYYLGVGLATLVNIFNPAVVAIAGGVSSLGETLLAPAREVVMARAFGVPAGRVKIETGSYGPATGAVGAALSVFEIEE